MTIAELIALFDVRDLPLRALQELEVGLQQQHRVRPLSCIDAALFMACREERYRRQHSAITIQPIDEGSRT